MKEIWRCIEGYCGLYKVSNKGRVKSVERYIKKSNGKLMFVKEKIKVPSVLKMGYYAVSLSKGAKQKSFYVHRMVAKAFIDNHENKEQVNHIDGDKLNNSIDNLEWCTPSENSLHAYDRGLSKKNLLGVTGERCKNAKYKVIAKKGNEEIEMVGNKDMINKGFSPSCINNCLKGKQKQHKGYFFSKVYL